MAGLAGTLVVTDYSGPPGRTLTVIDLPGLRVARTIDLVTYTRPHGIGFLPGDSLVIVSSEASRTVVIVNVVTGTVSKAVPTEAAGSHMVAAPANGGPAYTGSMGSHTVSEMDAEDQFDSAAVLTAASFWYDSASSQEL